MEKSIFEQIKKQNGEHFAKTIRAFDNGIFDIPGIVDIVKYAGREAEPILNYLVSLKNIHIEASADYKDPLQLLDEAGYNAYYVHSLQEQNAIKKYFAPDEELCTFFDEMRFQRFYIINAVKKNVDTIKREDFRGHEKREDAYGTSVISIQILRKGGFISIKNRYNDAVENPDNTFGSNPDNIIKGLSSALRQKFKTDFSSQTTVLPDNYVSLNNKIFHYHTEVGNSYIGSNFIATNNDITTIDKDKELILDHWVFNIKDRKLRDIAPDYYRKDGFPEVLLQEIQGKKVQLIKNPDHSHTLLADGKPVLTEKDGELIELTIRASKIPLNKPFLMENRHLRVLNLPNVKVLGNDVLTNNISLQKLYAPNIQKFGKNCLCENKMLRAVDLPNAQIFGDNFMENNVCCHTFNAPNVVEFGDFCLNQNKCIESLCFPHVLRIGDDFLIKNKILHEFIAPNFKSMGRYFLASNLELTSLDLDSVRNLGEGFLQQNTKLSHLGANNVTYIDSECLANNLLMQELFLPNVETIEDNFMMANKQIKRFLAPKLKGDHIGPNFFASHKNRSSFLKKLNIRSQQLTRQHTRTGR